MNTQGRRMDDSPKDQKKQAGHLTKEQKEKGCGKGQGAGDCMSDKGRDMKEVNKGGLSKSGDKCADACDKSKNVGVERLDRADKPNLGKTAQDH